MYKRQSWKKAAVRYERTKKKTGNDAEGTLGPGAIEDGSDESKGSTIVST